MASRNVPGLDLKAEWELYETSWKSGMDENLRRLSLYTQLRVHGRVTSLPSGAAQGDRYIYVNDGDTYHNHIAVWDLGMWVFYPPIDLGMCVDMATSTILLYATAFGGWAEMTSPAAIKAAYESNLDTNAFTDAEKAKLSGIENNATADMTAAEIKTAYESNPNSNAFTDAEKAKLNALSASRFLGVYPTLTALRAAHPAPPEGSFAYVDQGPNTDIMSYIWDVNDLKYVPQASGNTQETPESVKVKYEANDNTNAFTDDEKAKLAALSPDGATLPPGGTAGQVLTKQTDSDGDADWVDLPEFPEPLENELPDPTGENGKVLTVVDDIPTWVTPEAGGNTGIEDAPSDGKSYVRKDAEWVELEIEPGSAESLYKITNTATSIILGVDAFNGHLRMNSVSDVLVHIPSNTSEAIPVGSCLNIIQVGEGFFTVRFAGGVANFAPKGRKSLGLGSVAHLMKVAENSWDIWGELGVEDIESVERAPRLVGSMDELAEFEIRNTHNDYRAAGGYDAG